MVYIILGFILFSVIFIGILWINIYDSPMSDEEDELLQDEINIGW